MFGDQTPGRRIRQDQRCYSRAQGRLLLWDCLAARHGPHLRVHTIPWPRPDPGVDLCRKPLLPAVLPSWSISWREPLLLPSPLLQPSGLALLQPVHLPTLAATEGPVLMARKTLPETRPHPGYPTKGS